MKIDLSKAHLIVIVGASIDWRGDRICVLPLVVDVFVIMFIILLVDGFVSSAKMTDIPVAAEYLIISEERRYE